jgi:pimeloyl-ACP methyl ester carboxylesterase
MRSIAVFVGVTLLGGALLSGCEGGSAASPQPINFTPAPAPAGTGFVALYAPPVDVVPYPNDLYNPTGTKLQVPGKITSPLATALNTLDGFSTTAVVSAPFNAPLDPASLVPFNPLSMAPSAASIFVLNATNGTPLVPGVHYTVRISSAVGTGDGVLEIVPLVPFQPRTRYAFIVTSGVRSTAGVAAGADTVFRAVRDAHLAGLTSVPNVPQLTPLFPAITPLIDTATGLLGLPGSSVAVAWTMQTQSVSDVLDVIEATATPRPAVLVSAGITTAQLGLGLPGIASIYTGYMEVPYYGDPLNPLTSFWINSSLAPPNVQNPTPVARVPNRRIPMLATLPNAQSGQTQPPGGWPVVIFQHGITLNRTLMLAIADGFAQAGFAVVAIDLPLHGVTDTASPFYQGPTSPFGDNERHFNLDNVGDTGVFAPDGEIDNGWQILNVGNPLNARDHIRQAVADTIALTRTVPTLDFPDGDTNPDLDGSRIHFVGISLGSIISGVFLGVNAEVTTATLSSPAGPWTSILTDPEAIDFGAPIRAALSAQGLPAGTVGFANFVRDLQTVIDPVDPVNYAADAAANHPLHVIEVLGDTAVPNTPNDYIAELWGLPSVSTTLATAPPGTVSGIVRFNSGGHSSFFNPAINPAVTVEMQRQAVTYAASAGSVIQITNASVVD